MMYLKVSLLAQLVLAARHAEVFFSPIVNAGILPAYKLISEKLIYEFFSNVRIALN